MNLVMILAFSWLDITLPDATSLLISFPAEGLAIIPTLDKLNALYILY